MAVTVCIEALQIQFSEIDYIQLKSSDRKEDARVSQID